MLVIKRDVVQLVLVAGMRVEIVEKSIVMASLAGKANEGERVCGRTFATT